MHMYNAIIGVFIQRHAVPMPLLRPIYKQIVRSTVSSPLIASTQARPTDRRHTTTYETKQQAHPDIVATPIVDNPVQPK